jgi:hypothetical protein
LTRQVVDRADARRDPEGVPVLKLVGDPVARLEAAVEAIRAGREPADEALFDGIGQRRRHCADQARVHPASHAARARRAADAHRRVELRGLAWIELVRQKFDACSVVSHCGVSYVEPHAVIERQMALGFQLSCAYHSTFL